MIKSAFPKIWHLGHKNIKDLFDYEVEVTEKIDGSQFVVGMDKDGKMYMRSKGAPIDILNPPKLFYPVVNYFQSIYDKFPLDTILYGETLSNKRHNTIDYETIPKNHFALFGISNFDGDEFINSYDQLLSTSQVLGFDVVPLLYRGRMNGFEDVEKLMGTISYLGGHSIEGVVCKAYQPIMLYGQHVPLMAGKFVSEEFKEKHSKNPDWQPKKNKIQEEFERYNTEARFQKCVNHLRENGELEGEPRDIGKLMKEFNIDLTAECKEEIKDFLWGVHKKDFYRVASHGLPQWYKEQLAKGEIEV